MNNKGSPVTLANAASAEIKRICEGVPEIQTRRVTALGQLVLLNVNHDYSDVKLCELLLKLKTSVDGQEDIEVFLRYG